MVNTLDILVVGAAAYYASEKLQEDDEGFKRLMYGTAAGLPVALRGPEAFEAAKDYVQNAGTEEKRRAVGSVVAGGLGYAFGNKVLGYEKEKSQDDE